MVVDWRGDNAGPPPTAQDVIDDWNKLSKQFPNAEIIPSTFDDWADAVSSVPDEMFPVISKEIGDTWIYGFVKILFCFVLLLFKGIASDPAKTREMRVLQSMRSEVVVVSFH